MKVKFYKEDIVKRARILRRQGLSGNEIAKKLGVNNDSTVLRWCHNIISDNAYHLRFQEIYREARNKNKRLVKSLKLSEDLAKILAGLLYWCEGSKYPSSNFVAFSNSEPELVKTFLLLFRLGFSPKEEKIRASIQIHTTHNKEEILNFWSNLLKIPQSQFYKPTITCPTKNMKRVDYKGTCTVRYYDFLLLHELMGIYNEFGSKFYT